jgi:DNA polymerase III delta prime subunit
MTTYEPWVSRFRPKTVRDCVLPQALGEVFQSYVDKGELPNLTLAGPSGTGKSSIALALCHELDLDVLKINASMYGNIDTLRTKISDFASLASFSGQRKVVFLDEADYLNPQSTMPALRSFIEDHASNVGFILTCNYPQKIIAPLLDRCPVIRFDYPKMVVGDAEKSREAVQLMVRFGKVVEGILQAEGVIYDLNMTVIMKVIRQHYPSWRKVLTVLEQYAKRGRIDSGILAQAKADVAALFGYMKKKDFPAARAWVAANADVDSATLFREVYTHGATFVKPESVPGLVVLLGDYQYKSSMVADQEINFSAFVAHCMSTLTFKE